MIHFYVYLVHQTFQKSITNACDALVVCSSSFESASRVVCEDKFSTNARRSFIRCAKELLEATLKVLTFKSGLSIYLSYFSTGLRMLVHNDAKIHDLLFFVFSSSCCLTMLKSSAFSMLFRVASSNCFA